MLIVGLGALLMIVGVLYMAAQPIWRARLSRPPRPDATTGTLEPRRPGAGFGIAPNLPGVALVAIGAILLLVGATF